jgi:hypothetical protein
VRSWTSAHEGNRLRTNPAPDLKDLGPCGEEGVTVKDPLERRGLVIKPSPLARVITVDVT